MELKTPLYDRHLAAGGRMVPYAGYILPVQYDKGVVAEHMAVREGAGLFDVSHMGELMLTGPGALSNLNRILTNDFTNMADGRVRYSPMCNEDGGVVDDVIVYRFGQEEYMVVVNAANRHKDAEWVSSHLLGDVKMTDVSDNTAQIALQGPRSFDILKKCANEADIPKKYYTFKAEAKVGGRDCIISQTGYTGESGYELYCAPDDAKAIWDTLLEAGSEFGVIPCGLGARDTLRLEAAMPLYGHEINDEITPLEAGLDFGVKLQKGDFIGKAGIAKKLPLTRARVGLKMTGRGIARENCAVFAGDVCVGKVTSGSHCPYLGGAFAMALLEAAHSAVGTPLEAEVRGRRIACEIVPMPFYKRAK